MKIVDDVLFNTWNTTPQHTERDYLRSLHEKSNLIELAKALNSVTLSRGFAVQLSSLWVDWQPQCWKWNETKKIYAKPSVELADLVVIVWDNPSKTTGKALILAAKMADAPDKFSLSGPSTKKEITLLESPYRFLISNSLSGTPKTLPGFTKADFDFSKTGGFALWRWLLIRKKSTKKWTDPTIRFTLKKSAAGPAKYSFSDMLEHMVSGGKGYKYFKLGCTSCEWCRLINLLLGHTATNPAHPKALAPAQVNTFASNLASSKSTSQPANYSFFTPSLLSCIPARFINQAEAVAPKLSESGGGEGSGYFDNFDEMPHPQCSFIFVSKSEPPDFVRRPSESVEFDLD